jgi:uncharacterized protein
LDHLIVSVADIIGRPGKYRDIALQAWLQPVGNALARLEEQEVGAHLRAESVVEGVLVTGRLEALAALDCARCLSPNSAPISVEVCELFVSTPEVAGEDEAYRLRDTDMDLGPMLVDALTLALPLRPLCREDCRGLCATCGTNLNEGECDCTQETLDPRWAPLAALRERLESQS